MHSSRPLRAFVRTSFLQTPRASLGIAASGQRLHHTSLTPTSTPTPTPTPAPRLPRSARPAPSRTTTTPRCARHESTQRAPLTDAPATPSPPAQPRADVPSYEMTFTCKACQTRSSHRVSKQGYYHGTVLITCPGCKARHLISDHLQIFSNKSITLEDIMRNKGQLVKRGRLDAESDVEFWDDGTETKRGSSPTDTMSSAAANPSQDGQS